MFTAKEKLSRNVDEISGYRLGGGGKGGESDGGDVSSKSRTTCDEGQGHRTRTLIVFRR